MKTKLVIHCIEFLKRIFFLLLWLLSSDVNRVFLSSILPQRSVFKKEKKATF